MFNVVLVEPEIPPNTGSVGRLCLATGSTLHLVGQLGFSLSSKQLRRAGLDYWDEVPVRQWESFEDLELDSRAVNAQAAFHFLTTKSGRPYWDASFHDGDYLVFGSETRGLPASLREANAPACLTIPMEGTRSLNLATAVGIVLYEGMRQIGGR